MWTSEILKQLKVLFGSVTAIPAQVFLTGVCLQIPDGPSAEVKEILEEFLMKWRYVDGKYNTIANVEADVSYKEEFSNQISLRVDKYLEIIELYVITFLGRILGNFDLAISWVEKYPLPDEKRQDLLRQLHSMNTLKLGSSSQSSALPLQIDEFTLKFGSSRLVLSNGSVLLGFLVALVHCIVRRKQASLWSVVKSQASSTKKALVDFWQLAFSYQVNPLAAVQPLPPATRGSR
ncbi:hypothetical protein MTR67_052838 [Solanum verrucosum]|uniref:Uncharacterized protein n=1 Tax=Solanum verrucosum TaxID=315347 RepID=A0AAF0V5T8_SOLVR|nr:hypothetical protein MTR67_052838 [Solanum verrucosum]